MRYRLLGFLVGFAIVVLGTWFLGKGSSPKPSRVLSESGGSLSIVEIQYTREAASVTWPALTAFFSQIDPKVEVLAACGSGDDARAIRAAWRWKNPLRTVLVGAEITGWSKDRFLVAGRRPAFLLCPKPVPSPLPTRNNDSEVASKLAAFSPSEFRTLNEALVFDAGDILCSEDTAFFSDVLWGKNLRRSDLASEVARLTGRSPLWLKGVPPHHIGMFAAPLDNHVVMVGDPDLGQKLWSPAATKRLGAPDDSLAATRPFRTALAQFLSARYKVVRLPTVVMEPQVYVTYTNAVFERRGTRRVVYMPVYGLPSLDAAATAAYKSVGWEVRPIPVASVFRMRGTIGCLVNVLERR